MTQIVTRDREIVNDDRVQFEVLSSIEPHPQSDYGPSSFGFQNIAKSVRQVWGGSDNVIVSPSESYSLVVHFNNKFNIIEL